MRSRTEKREDGAETHEMLLGIALRGLPRQSKGSYTQRSDMRSAITRLFQLTIELNVEIARRLIVLEDYRMPAFRRAW